jgi:hypothetical protein
MDGSRAAIANSAIRLREEHSIWKREHHRNSIARQLVECGVKVVRHASLQSYQLDP